MYLIIYFIQIVNSEYEKSIQSDPFRKQEIFRSLIKKTSLFSHFSCGNLETLLNNPKKNNINVREELVNHFNTKYSANIMTLAIIGKEPIDILEGYVRKYFSDIVNKNIERTLGDGDVFGDGIIKQFITFIPIKSVRKV